MRKDNRGNFHCLLYLKQFVQVQKRRKLVKVAERYLFLSLPVTEAEGFYKIELLDLLVCLLVDMLENICEFIDLVHRVPIDFPINDLEA